MHKFKLYIASTTLKSSDAIEDFKKELNKKFQDKYSLEVINVLDNAEIAEKEKILATPTLVKYEPPPVKKCIGDISTLKSALGIM